MAHGSPLTYRVPRGTHRELVESNLQTITHETIERWQPLRLLVAASTLLLVFATWPLWWPSQHFPQVPWCRFLRTAPVVLDQMLIVTVIASLSLAIVTHPRENQRDWCLLLFTIAAISLLALNQHRTQPWMVLSILIAISMTSTSRLQASALVKILVIGVYVYSGISKLNVVFCTGLGTSFWQTGWRLLTGIALAPGPGVSGWPLIFPAIEILVAVGLMLPNTRRIATVAACIMHGLLIVLLSPWGLNHRPGVLIWNLFFIVLNPLLFWNTSRTGQLQHVEASEQRQSHFNSVPPILTKTLIAAALILPATEPWGGCDVWLAWGLYAEHGEQMLIQVSDSGLAKLPPIWRKTATPVQASGDAPSNVVKNAHASTDSNPHANSQHRWTLRVKFASLQQLKAPVYPANRFQLGVALQLARQFHLANEEIAAIWLSRANSWTGLRETKHLGNLNEIQQAADACWWNAQPRLASN